ncbi:MAG: histidine kinase [Aquincola sp.]|nr:histidine kinase [Aquincola sp.]
MNRKQDAARASDPTYWRRCLAALTGASVGWAVGLAITIAVVLSPTFIPPWPVLFGRTLFIAIVCLLAYTAAGQWRGSPIPRWMAQVLAVALAGPLATLFVYVLSTGGNLQEMFGNPARVMGIGLIGGSALVLGLIITLGALYRERDAQANAQALQFALERETLQRQTADAKLAVLQSQIEPHFLFNTLANVQALVEGGSPRAAPVLASLIAYLRAAMPQLQDGAPTLGREEQLVRAYLDLMHMRMPDRLHYAIEVEPALRNLTLPPMTLLTLVENAVRHGIDPSEAGGHIEVGARREVGSVRLWVADSGGGIDETKPPGIGLANLRERLAATFGGRATLTLHAVEPHGVRAEIEVADENPGS